MPVLSGQRALRTNIEHACTTDTLSSAPPFAAAEQKAVFVRAVLRSTTLPFIFQPHVVQRAGTLSQGTARGRSTKRGLRSPLGAFGELSTSGRRCPGVHTATCRTPCAGPTSLGYSAGGLHVRGVTYVCKKIRMYQNHS